MAAATVAGFNGACGDGNLDVFATRAATAGTGNAPHGGASGSSGASAGGTSNLGGDPSPGGGTAGSGTAPPNPLPVDDFEDGNTQPLFGDGHWYVSNDGTGTQTFGLELAPDRPSGSHAMRTRGFDFTEWGAALGVDLEGSTPALDLTAYDELSFAIRAEAEFEVALSISLLDVDDVHYARPVELTSEWQELRLPLASFVDADGDALDRSRVGDLQFFTSPNQPFDFWIDDIAFHRAR